MKVNVYGGEMSPNEIDLYMDYLGKKYRGRQIDQVDITIDGDFVDIKTRFKDTDFQHAYRSADYLVKSMDKLNDAKQKEFMQKEKHKLGENS